VGKFCAEGRGRGEGGTERLAHGGDRVQDNAGVTVGRDNGIVRSEDARECGVETKDVIQGRVAVERQHEVARRLAGPATADQLGLFGTGILDPKTIRAFVRFFISFCVRSPALYSSISSFT